MMSKFTMEENMQFGDDWPLGQSFDNSLYDDLDLTGLYDVGPFDDFLPSKPVISNFDYIPMQNVEDAGSIDQSWMEIKRLLEDPEPETITMEDPLVMASLPAVKKEEEDDCAAYKNTVLYSMLKEPSKQKGTLSDLPSQQLDGVSEVKWEVLTPPPSSPEPEVIPVIHIPEVLGSEPGFDPLNLDGAFLQSPLSSDDIESILSSPVPSPPSSSNIDTSLNIDTLSTIDASSLVSVEETIVFDSDLYEVVPIEKPKQIRGTPYSRPQKNKSKGRKQTASISSLPTDLELEFMSKKDRKKLQNKNAAIRYRMKKKEEADVKKSEEEVLEDENKVLQGKVDDLTRQITYMKDLINEVRKARGQSQI